MTFKTKDINIFLLKEWESYLKNIYESPISMDNNPNFHIEDEVVSLIYEIKFGAKQLAKGKPKDIEGYQTEMLNWRGYHHLLFFQRKKPYFHSYFYEKKVSCIYTYSAFTRIFPDPTCSLSV